MSWIDDFSSNELIAPFTVEYDNDYRDDLKNRYKALISTAEEAGADQESLDILKDFSFKINGALGSYYRGEIASCYQKIQNLVRDCIESDKDDHIAVCNVNSNVIFPRSDIHADKSESVDWNNPAIRDLKELQLFRARESDDAGGFSAKEMFHLPFNLRSRTSNYRFSIPGVPSLYLANTSYGCWIELERPSEHNFNVSPVLLDNTQSIFNLVVSITEHSLLDIKVGDTGNTLSDEQLRKVHTWLKLVTFMIATSYKVKEKGRSFKSEYIISQAIMIACNHLKISGVGYYSKRVENEFLARAAINLALFAPYRYHKDYAELCEHLKVDDSFNYMMFRQLERSETEKDYDLRIDDDPYIQNIGKMTRQYSYRETEFYRFDKFMFSRWKEEGKDLIVFGNAMI